MSELANGEEFDFNVDWIGSSDYELKILLMTCLLAENNLAFRGSLKTMRQWLGLKDHPDNNQKIKQAIDDLVAKEYMIHFEDGRTHTLSISNKDLQDHQLIKIRKKWIETIKNYKSLNTTNNNYVDWSKLVKVFIYLFTNDNEVKTAFERASEIGISESTFSRSLSALLNLDFDEYSLDKKIIKEKIGDSWESQGTQITIGIDYDSKVS